MSHSVEVNHAFVPQPAPRPRSRSRRLAMALVATGAAVGLLLGGVGTFSKWYESTAVGSGAVQSGHLDWTVAAGTWDDLTSGSAVPIADITAFHMVPGDTVRYSTSVEARLVGDNISATLTADVTGLTGTLASYVVVTPDVGGSGTGSTVLTGAGTTTVPVTITVSLPATVGDTNGTDAEDASLDLSGMELTLQQD